jgi:multidrug resistance efflux pump
VVFGSERGRLWNAVFSIAARPGKKRAMIPYQHKAGNYTLVRYRLHVDIASMGKIGEHEFGTV